MSTFGPFSRNSFGNLTAWLLPERNTLAVGIALTFQYIHQRISIRTGGMARYLLGPILRSLAIHTPAGSSFPHLARMRSSSALLERATTGNDFFRRNGMQASMITRELRRSVSPS